MSSITRSILCYLPALCLLVGQTTARHSHHHHIRQIVVAVPNVSADPTPSTTIQAIRVSSQASHEVISDIQDIKEGIEDLPGNLLSYIQSVDQRLETIEALLQGLLSGATPPPIAELPSASATPTANTRIPPGPFVAPGASMSPTGGSASTTSYSIQSNTTQTSEAASTTASTASPTRQVPVPVLSTAALSGPFSYTLRGNGTLATPTAGRASSTGRKVVTLTVAVLPMPSTVTLPESIGGNAPTTFATLVRTA